MNAPIAIQKPKHPQLIFAVQQAYFDSICFADGSPVFVQGLNNYSHFDFLDQIQKHIVVAQRSMLEENPRYRQLLPYVIVRQLQENGEYLYFTYRRTSGVGESRLAGNVSIGYGGHIDLIDAEYMGNSIIDIFRTIYLSAIREIDEEIETNMGKGAASGDLNFASQFILDDTNEVGKVHVGIIMTFDIPTGIIINCKEDELTSMPPMTAIELLGSNLPLENWSEIYLRYVVDNEENAKLNAADREFIKNKYLSPAVAIKTPGAFDPQPVFAIKE